MTELCRCVDKSLAFRVVVAAFSAVAAATAAASSSSRKLYSLRFLIGRLIMSRTNTTDPDSLSGDDDRSGDSGEERGGVNNGSAPANAASTRRTSSFDDL